jgi:hypothetical protein
MDTVRTNLLFRVILMSITTAIAFGAFVTVYVFVPFVVSQIQTGALPISVGKSRTASEDWWSHTFRWHEEPIGFLLNALGLVSFPIALGAVGLLLLSAVISIWRDRPAVEDLNAQKVIVSIVGPLVKIFGLIWLLLFFGLRLIYAMRIVHTA